MKEKEVFKRLGLSEKETDVYMTLLEYGATTAGNLAKKMNIPRATLYGFLDKLSSKGIVSVSESNNTKFWQAESPEKILSLIQQEANDIEKIHSSFLKQIPTLKALQNQDFNFPRFSYFEGIEGVKHVIRDVLFYRDIETLAFWPIQDMLDILTPDFLYEHNAQRIRQNISIRSIWPLNKQVDIHKHIYLGVGKEFKREIRTPPEDIVTTMGYWIYGNRIGYVSSKAECFGCIIESSEMRQLLQTQFEFIWQFSKKIETNKDITRKFIEDNSLN